MKKHVLKLMLACTLITVLLSCSSDDDNSPVNTDTSQIVSAAQSGTWSITSFVDSGNDETNHFTGYAFTFGSNGVLTAVNGDTTVTGTWSVTTDDSNDDNPSGDVDFNIAFASPADFVDLTDDWDIVTVTSTTISLIDVSGGNGGTDTLMFQKN
ncbi:hypothetical protein Q763_00970 [Flavobacterium beibuense F44-8]|uniref:Lipocalin-like domain-containing protein n=1 Tax=Flavobacterium beibuense F44-8 TaxID=1406840 RepID=A0A0A2LWG9_9FLAO|nr:hypothetical protein [Flavobacterium beibuense]KGO84349.1 hypothetical protein Q763_00970 [Flavobacterium beibuense F44-8]